jgi:hypothetical protein
VAKNFGKTLSTHRLLDINVTKSVRSTLQQIDSARNLTIIHFLISEKSWLLKLKYPAFFGKKKQKIYLMHEQKLPLNHFRCF